MYRFLGSHTYAEGYLYSGSAIECYYSFYASKDTPVEEIKARILERSGQAAGEQGSSMLTIKMWVDESGANNDYAVRFNAHGPSVSNRIEGTIMWAQWIYIIIETVLIGIAIGYIVKTIRDISYSPGGQSLFESLKWLGIGAATLGGVYLVNKYLPKKRLEVAK